jgi:glycosyltransferase involved in cell wall biosynthesis
MEKITFVIPSRNNLEFLQLAYKSIRDLKTKHEILVLNDASTDGTQEWMDSLDDDDLIVHNNPGPKRIGIVGMFDKGIEIAGNAIMMSDLAISIPLSNIPTIPIRLGPGLWCTIKSSSPKLSIHS